MNDWITALAAIVVAFLPTAVIWLIMEIQERQPHLALRKGTGTVMNDHSLPDGLAAPPGCTWHRLSTGDHVLLAPLWRDLSAALAGTPFWQRWLHALVDCRSGRFDPHFMQLLGLFDSNHSLLALAAEVEHFDDHRTSQILFSVPTSSRGRGLGRYALRSGLALARQRGSHTAVIETRCSNKPCLNLLRSHGLKVRYEANQGADYFIVRHPLRSRLASFFRLLPRADLLTKTR